MHRRVHGRVHGRVHRLTTASRSASRRPSAVEASAEAGPDAAADGVAADGAVAGGAVAGGAVARVAVAGGAAARWASSAANSSAMAMELLTACAALSSMRASHRAARWCAGKRAAMRGMGGSDPRPLRTFPNSRALAALSGSRARRIAAACWAAAVSLESARSFKRLRAAGSKLNLEHVPPLTSPHSVCRARTRVASRCVAVGWREASLDQRRPDVGDARTARPRTSRTCEGEGDR